MMKKQVLYSLVSAVLLTVPFASCTNEVQEMVMEQPQALKQIVMTTQDFQQEADSRTLYRIADGAVTCTWAENDTVGVFPNEGMQTSFPMTTGAGAKNATFNGGGWALKDGSTYAAYYPFIGDMYLNGKAVPVDYTGQKQVGDASTAHLGAYDYMVATPTAPAFGSAKFTFKHLNALVQLKLTIPQPATITSVKLVAETDAFAVQGKVDIMAAAAAIAPVTLANEVKLDLQDVVTTEDDQVVTLYMMLPPADLSAQTLKAVVTTDKGTEEFVFEGKNFKAGMAYGLVGNIEEEDIQGDGTYKDGVVSLKEAGTMVDLLGDELLEITSLKVVGPINGYDIYYLRMMSGGHDFSQSSWGKLNTLDLSKATIVEGDWYYTLSDNKYETSNDVIGDYMFYSCANLQKVILPEGAVSIGYNAFADCDALSSVVIGDAVTTIGNQAFYHCDVLDAITIGRGVTTIDKSAFSYCYELNDVYIKDLSSWCNISFLYDNSTPLLNGANLYLNGNKLTELVIPEGIKEIKFCAFLGCQSIEKVTIGTGVTSIGGMAFENCDFLTSVNIGSDVTTIGSYAFYDCDALTSIDIPDNITSLGALAFIGCDALKSAVIGNGVKKINISTFSQCDALTSVVIGSGVTTIGNSVFHDCDALTSIEIPDNVTSIGEMCFDFCDALKDVTIGHGVTKIPKQAFYGCTALTSITIGKNVASIGQQAFYSCTALTDFYCHANTPPTIDLYAFKTTYSDQTTLHVPARCSTDYKSAKWGTYFKNIKEMR